MEINNFGMIAGCFQQYQDGRMNAKCKEVLKLVDGNTKNLIDENFGDIVYQHVPLSVFTGIFTYIFWPIKFFVYLFDADSVASAQDDQSLEKGDQKKSAKEAKDKKWWFDWLQWDLRIMWPAWYVFQQFFSGGEALVFDSLVNTYGNTDTAMFYLWAIIWYPFELVFDALIFVVLSPVYLIDGLVRLFDGDNK